MKELFEKSNILTHRFFQSMYWKTFCGKKDEPVIGPRAFLGALKNLICNKTAFGIEGLNIACAIDYDDDENKLIDKVFFVSYTQDWSSEDWDEAEEFIFVSYPEFIMLVEEVLIQYAVLQEKRWRKYPHVREVEKQEIELIKECLYANFRTW